MTGRLKEIMFMKYSAYTIHNNIVVQHVYMYMHMHVSLPLNIYCYTMCNTIH